MFSETRYAKNGDLRVACRASAEGERDIVWVPGWFTNCEVVPDLPSINDWLEALTSLGRVILFDQPGTGASDPVTPDALPTLEQWSDSVTAVLDDLGSDSAALIAAAGAFAPAALFAAAYPSRTTTLVLLEGYADPISATQGKWSPEDAHAAMLAMWGTGEFEHIVNPEMPWNEEVRAAWARVERLSASPRTVALMWPLVAELDTRAVCPTIRVPTLVVQHTDDAIVVPAKGRYLGSHILGAKYVELAGRNMYHFVEPWRDSFREIAEFLTGHHADVADDRVLATVLFTDIVASTRRAADLGDRNWRALLDAHDAVIRVQLARFRGREVSTAGDGFLVTFDGPQGAIRCAMAIREAVRALGIEVRAGLHTGECEIRGDDIRGIAVHIGARVCALAEANDILVSSTLRDLVIGSGLEFDDCGIHHLKGVPGEWRLFAPNWMTCCEHLPELPSLKGWVEAMGSLGRLIFFDQPGTGASDPVTADALPTLEQWSDSITAVLDALGSREAVLLASNGGFATSALFAATHPSRTTALVVLDGYANTGPMPEELRSAMLSNWGTGEMQHVVNPDMPWNEEIRAAWARHERLAASPATVSLVLDLATKFDARAILPTIRVPTLVLHHTNDQVIAPHRGKYIADPRRVRSMLSCLVATRSTSSSRGGTRFRKSPNSSPAAQPTSTMTGFSPRCCSPTSSTRRAGPRRLGTGTGVPCSTRTTR